MKKKVKLRKKTRNGTVFEVIAKHFGIGSFAPFFFFFKIHPSIHIATVISVLSNTEMTSTEQLCEIKYFLITVFLSNSNHNYVP